MVQRENVNIVILASDCQLAITILNQEEIFHDLYANVIKECRKISKLFREVKFVFIRRENNKVADMLAKDARKMEATPNVVRELSYPPNYCTSLLGDDCIKLFQN